jgi:putative iron-dependent peroxidase
MKTTGLVTGMRELNTQPAVLLPVPRQARYLSFQLNADIEPEASKAALRALTIDDRCVVGIGEPLVRHWGHELQGLKPFPAISGPGVDIPTTQQALWCWLKGDDRGELVHRTREIAGALEEAFQLETIVDAFKFGNEELGLDLTGYEDGTENPTGDDAIDAAIVDGLGPGMDGSSFVAVQQWVHDLDSFESMPQLEQDHIIGRRKSDNEEIEDAPESAHVKRTEQESFEPAAFIVRRSMPWSEGEKAGLLFVAFGKSLEAFETQLKRMAGLEDGIVDALFRFSKPVTGGYYWCPPAQNGQLDLNTFD